MFAFGSSLKGLSSLILFQLFATGVIDTDGKLPPVLLIPVANLPPVPLIPVVHLDLRRKFSKKFETVLMGYFGAGAKLIHKKSCDTVPLITFAETYVCFHFPSPNPE